MRRGGLAGVVLDKRAWTCSVCVCRVELCLNSVCPLLHFVRLLPLPLSTAFHSSVSPPSPTSYSRCTSAHHPASHMASPASSSRTSTHSSAPHRRPQRAPNSAPTPRQQAWPATTKYVLPAPSPPRRPTLTDRQCPVCNSTFTRPQHVARHMRSRKCSIRCCFICHLRTRRGAGNAHREGIPQSISSGAETNSSERVQPETSSGPLFLRLVLVAVLASVE